MPFMEHELQACKLLTITGQEPKERATERKERREVRKAETTAAKEAPASAGTFVLMLPVNTGIHADSVMTPKIPAELPLPEH